MVKGYIPQHERKNILLLTDDIRVHSGVGQIGREIVINTCHRYNWFQIAGAMQHPQKGERIDISEDIQGESSIEDAKTILYPTNGYGDPNLLRSIIKRDKIDSLFLITDPRYFTWLFNIENEIRRKIPIAYLNIWDNVPASHYNAEYYSSCDALFGISKLSVFNNKKVLEGANVPYKQI